MARYTEAVCRLCRREKQKLFLKGEKCYVNCTLDKRGYPPGQHGQRRGKVSTFGIQLREKQKVKRLYGVMERQFRRYFKIADRYRGVTGTVLLQLLERRLDNVLYRIGLAPSRHSARQMVVHGNVLVNGKKIDRPSYRTNVGDEITVIPKLKQANVVQSAVASSETRGRLPWISFNPDTLTGRIVNIPERDQIPVDVKEQLIVELYSK